MGSYSANSWRASYCAVLSLSRFNTIDRSYSCVRHCDAFCFQPHHERDLHKNSSRRKVKRSRFRGSHVVVHCLNRVVLNISIIGIVAPGDCGADVYRLKSHTVDIVANDGYVAHFATGTSFVFPVEMQMRVGIVLQ